MNFQAIVVSAWATLALAACGQSGTEGTFAPPYNCVCDPSQHDVAVRGMVQGLDPLRIEVTEIFADLPSDILQVGDQVGGTWTDELPCQTPGSLEIPQGPTNGAEVLVLIRRGNLDSYPNCAEYKSCTLAECGPPPSGESDPTDPAVGAWDACDGDCVTDTRQSCLTHRDEALLASEMRVMPWSESHNFGQLEGVEILVSTTELHSISLDDQSCQEAFPDALTEVPR
ncbi:MAG: hypothetical protein JKY56_03500 [Kofleriaceae bacterium]|nr:hypothetical protein [Kofleriaceae bacterium]